MAPCSKLRLEGKLSVAGPTEEGPWWHQNHLRSRGGDCIGVWAGRDSSPLIRRLHVIEPELQVAQPLFQGCDSSLNELRLAARRGLFGYLDGSPLAPRLVVVIADGGRISAATGRAGS